MIFRSRGIVVKEKKHEGWNHVWGYHRPKRKVRARNIDFSWVLYNSFQCKIARRLGRMEKWLTATVRTLEIDWVPQPQKTPEKLEFLSSIRSSSVFCFFLHSPSLSTLSHHHINSWYTIRYLFLFISLSSMFISTISVRLAIIIIPRPIPSTRLFLDYLHS